MRKISQKNKRAISLDPYYKVCARDKDGQCEGRLTIEHAIIFAGRQVDKLWCLLPLCSFHHSVNQFQDGGDLQKSVNVWIALNRATVAELVEVSKAVDYIHLRAVLNERYGVYRAPVVAMAGSLINY